MTLEHAISGIQDFRVVGRDEEDDRYYTVKDCDTFYDAIEVVARLEAMERTLNVKGISHGIYDDEGRKEYTPYLEFDIEWYMKPEKEKERIIRRQEKDGSWRVFLPLVGVLYWPKGIDSHWGGGQRLLYQVLCAGGIFYAGLKLIEHFNR